MKVNLLQRHDTAHFVRATSVAPAHWGLYDLNNCRVRIESIVFVVDAALLSHQLL